MNDPIEEAASLDTADPLAVFRERFALPGDDAVYLVGHSLGLQPVATRDLVNEELDKWARMGVRGHFESDRPWASFHELLTGPMARIVGAKHAEVVVMNALTVNLHLLMVSFYQPTAGRHKVLIEEHAFPSDHYAVESQIKMNGFDPAESMVVLAPRDGEETLRTEDIIGAIADHGEELALVMLPGVQYYTGQVFPMPEIVAAARAAGANVGLDLAHAVGNIELQLHDLAPDFAVWCTYKYLNGGPGATGGAYVHERHLGDTSMRRLHGWWGHEPSTRFEMDNRFKPPPTVDAWQLSNAAILSMAPLIASLQVFDDAGGIAPLREKSLGMSRFFDRLIDERLGGKVESITPRDPDSRGCQLSLRVLDGAGEGVFDQLQARRIECDWRNPDVIRVAPVPLYNSYGDIARFVDVLSEILT